MTVRAKFQVVSITEHEGWSGKTVHLAPRYDERIPEDRRFAQATPSGTLEMTVDNPAALAELALGRTFYLDFTPIDPPA